MNPEDRVIQLLEELRDQQREALEAQKNHVALTREQVERARVQVAESLALQKLAMARQKSVTRVAFTGIAICLALIAVLLLRYF